MSIHLNDISSEVYDGFVAVAPDDFTLRAYLRVGPIPPIITDDGQTDVASDYADLSLALSGLNIDGRPCLLTATAMRGEGFDAEVVDIDLSPLTTLDDVVAFRAQNRKVALSFCYVAPDIDLGAIAIAGDLNVDGMTWAFEGYLPRVREARNSRRAACGFTTPRWETHGDG